MILAEELKRIIQNFENKAQSIQIEGDRMEKHSNAPTYTLYRPDGEFTVKGLGWGHGHLFVITEERGTIGITYEHEPINDGYDEDEPITAKCEQLSLELWGVEI